MQRLIYIDFKIQEIFSERVANLINKEVRSTRVDILSTAITYSCVIAAEHFLNGPHTDVYRSISEDLVHLNTSAHRLYVV